MAHSQNPSINSSFFFPCAGFSKSPPCLAAKNPYLSVTFAFSPKAVKIHSGASRDQALERLASSDVRRAEASFPADKVRWWCCLSLNVLVVVVVVVVWWCHPGLRFWRGRCEVKWDWLVGWLVTSFQRYGGWFGVTGHGSSPSSSPGPPGLGLGQNRGRFPAGIAVVAKHLVLGQRFFFGWKPRKKRRLGLKGLELLCISPKNLVGRVLLKDFGV